MVRAVAMHAKHNVWTNPENTEWKAIDVEDKKHEQDESFKELLFKPLATVVHLLTERLEDGNLLFFLAKCLFEQHLSGF